MSKAGRVHAGSSDTHGGLSHSCDRPTSHSPAPRAQTISVPLASRETTRMQPPQCGGGPLTPRASAPRLQPESIVPPTAREVNGMISPIVGQVTLGIYGVLLAVGG